ncbi:hypothetical protein BDY21DRAFT_373501 [Lineolata rhizophorae]|uniref:Uncharacterized protein n=1 Tax=Lineolata rhizophorae TaxID=578093 RepID=A0A6A6NVE7_9PEZI|nr:hypothetical protein BDY21DRAFT_373501 [Lineolata rhizophorae]
MGVFGFLLRQFIARPAPIPEDVKLDGLTALITGATGGIGLEVARELVGHGVRRIILGVRDPQKGEEAKAELTRMDCVVEVWTVDCEEWKSTVAFGQRAQALDRLDIVILNAGVKKLKYSRAKTGHETNLQVNYLSTALLSLMLFVPLRATARRTKKPGRLSIVSCEVHLTPFRERSATKVLSHMNHKDTFTPFSPERYYTTKLLNVLWGRELSSRTDPKEVIVNVVNPGLCRTEIHRYEESHSFRLFQRLFGWNPAIGGHCVADAAVVADSDSHGAYISEMHVTEPSKFVSSTDGRATQSKLWLETMQLLRAEVPGAKLVAL